ncbi:MAG: DUF1552 domain-containing protein [Deltaproteobacteria bacterium]|nr:DUF1552 domain-containing protein [Deltaproteobacteria bacterium]
MNRITRRQFLRGAGSAIVALPTLVSLLPRAARASVTPPKRFVFFYHPNGIDNAPYSFRPKPGPSGTEADFTLGWNIDPDLAPWRSHLLWTSGINMRVAQEGTVGEQHQRGIGALLTGQKLAPGDFVGNDGQRAGWATGISLDQTLVSVIGQTTPIGSLQLGINARQRNNSGVVSYRGSEIPQLPENDPRQTYRSLFFTSGARDEIPIHVLRRQSVLDGVVSQLGSMKQRVSQEDSKRLDEHLTIVRDLEKRIASLPPPPPPAPAGTQSDGGSSTGNTGGTQTGGSGTSGSTGSTGPIGNPSDWPSYEGCAASGEPALSDLPLSSDAMPEMAHLQLELAALALRCDLTRVVTVVFVDAQDHIPMPFISVSDDIHNLSHLSDDDPYNAQFPRRDASRDNFRKRDRWQAQQFASMLAKLQTQEGDGSKVLDNTLLLWGSELSAGNTHSHLDIPFVIAGHALGWRTNRFVRFTNKNHNNLLLSILLGFGGSAASYGDPAYCSGELTGIA